MMKSIIALIFTMLSISALAQSAMSPWPRREIAIGVDNDYPLATDQYYTAGQEFSYRFLLNKRIPLFRNNDSIKSIFSLHYGNKIFNPKNLDTRDTRYMDRPYCGWNFVSAELRNFRRKNTSNFIALQAGLVGAESGMGQLQLWLHKTIHLYSVEGWASQIRNEVVINVNVNHTHGFELGKRAELVSSSGAWAGTGSNKITQEFTLRLFRFNPLNQSAFMNATLSGRETRRNRSEFFMFASLGGEFVLSNIFIQGSLFRNNPSPFTTSINPLFFSQKLGVQYSTNRISFALMIVHLTKETSFVSFHNYVSGSLAYRF
jgi:hypothetical protein